MVITLMKKILMHAPAVCLISSSLMLIFAYSLEHLSGLVPCEMCLWQRWPLFLVVFFSILSILVFKKYSNLFILFAGSSFLISSFLGIWHSGYEMGYLPGPTSCSNNNISLQSNFEEILNQSMVSCQDILWSFLGISLAGWNAIISLLLATFCFISLINYRLNYESKY